MGSTPSAEELDSVYARYSYDEQHLEALPAFLRAAVAEKVRTFAKYRCTGRLLDVGFGAGALLRAASEQGWEPHGIEVSSLAVAQARANGFEHVVQGDFLSAPFEPGSFDVVVMSELVEHLPDPLEFLRAARRLLAPGGLLYLTTPHGRGVSGRLLGATWSVCAPPEHLHLFSSRSMRLALENTGFTASRVEVRNVHPHELLQRARNVFARREPSTPKTTFAAADRVTGSYRLNAALLGSPAGVALKRAANSVLNATTLGDGLVVYAVACDASATAPRSAS